MKFKELSKLGLGVLTLTLLLLGSWSFSSTAATNELIGLIEVSPARAAAGDPIVFSVDYGRSLGLGLPQSRIAAVTWEFGDGNTRVQSDLKPITFRYGRAGTYFAKVTISFSTIAGVAAPPSISGTQKILIEQAGGSGGLNASAAAAIRSYDSNSDDRLSNTEFFMIVDGWISGSLPQTTFFAAIDLWINSGSIRSLSVSSASQEFRPQVAQRSANTLIFSAGSRQFTRLQVRIFDAEGRFITSQQTTGHLLNWNVLSESGKPLANGVYYYALSAYDPQGQLVESTLKSLYLMGSGRVMLKLPLRPHKEV